MLNSLKNLFKSADQPTASTTSTEDTAPSAPPAPDDEDLGTVSVTLAKIIEKLPPNLLTRVDKMPDPETKAQFLASGILPQLAKGSIKVTFAELGAAAPEYFSGVSEHAAEIIELPLGEILPQLDPAMLKRKAPKKTAPVVAPHDFFGGIKPITTNPAAETATSASRAPSATVSSAFSPVVPTQPTEPAVKKAEEPAATNRSGEWMADLSLPVIVAGLPPALRALVQNEPGPETTASFPIQQLVRQLAQGKIHVPFGELIAASSAGIFSDIGGHEEDDVMLPLAEVLAKAGPGALKRKQPTKKLTGVEGRDFFGGAGKTVAPSTPAPSPEPDASPARQPTPVFQPGPGPAAAPLEPVPVSKSNEAEPEFVEIPLQKVMVKFPDELKLEISGFAEKSVVVFPCERLGHALKTGKVYFTWQEIKSWLRPTVSFGANSWDSSKVDIPLRAIVGPFMAAMRGSGAATSSTAKTQSAPAAQSTPAKSESEPGAAAGHSVVFFTPQLPPAPAWNPPPAPDSPTAEAPSETTSPDQYAPPPKIHLGELLGNPEKTEWTPVEIVQRVAGLPSISGAFISLAEGQVVAFEMPSVIEADVVALRIPKLFNQASELVSEMQLEPMNHIAFSSGAAPWLVFKLGNIFFTVQGRAGDVLPLARLQSLALEIGRQRK